MEKLIVATESDFLSLVRTAVREELKSINVVGSNENTVNQPLNISQAAAFIDRPISTLYSLVRKQEIPHHKKGKRLYFTKADLIKWVESGKVQTIGDIELDADRILTGIKNK